MSNAVFVYRDDLDEVEKIREHPSYSSLGQVLRLEEVKGGNRVRGNQTDDRPGLDAL